MPTATLARPAARAATAARRPAVTTRAHTWTITAALVAARTEDDGAIALMLADPTGRPHRMMVVLPDAARNAGFTPASRRARIARARATFEREIVSPPFEGYASLYGAARLTLAMPGPDAAGARRCTPLVVGFAAL